jgi:hypothetical protein
MKPGSGFAIFVIFFGVAALQAIRDADWKWIVFWIVAGLLFLLADNMKKKDRSTNH